MEFIDSNAFRQSLKPLIEAIRTLGKQNFPFTRKAMQRAAYHIADYWVKSSSGHPIEGTNRTIRDAEYARSINVLKMDDFRYIIGSSDRERHRKIEEGTPQYDFKSGLGRYRKTKYNKKGEPYLTVPFRHRVADLKQAKRENPKTRRRQSVSSFLKGIQKSSVIHNDPVSNQRTYNWAGKIKSFNEEMRAKHHKADIFSGMVRFETSTGMGTSSAYMTFRTVSIHSHPDSWIIPARPGIPMTKLVFDATKKDALQMIEGGIMADFKVLGIAE